VKALCDLVTVIKECGCRLQNLMLNNAYAMQQLIGFVSHWMYFWEGRQLHVDI